MGKCVGKSIGTIFGAVRAGCTCESGCRFPRIRGRLFEAIHAPSSAGCNLLVRRQDIPACILSVQAATVSGMAIACCQSFRSMLEALTGVVVLVSPIQPPNRTGIGNETAGWLVSGHRRCFCFELQNGDLGLQNTWNYSVSHKILGDTLYVRIVSTPAQ